MQALARALLPDGPDGKPTQRPTKHPAATLRAVEALVPELASMLEVRSGCVSSVEKCRALRATCLLHAFALLSCSCPHFLPA